MLSQTEDLVMQRLTLSRQLMELSQEEGRARVLEGKELGERIRNGFEQMKGNENALLATRSHDTAMSANLTIFMVISGSLLSIALLLLVYRKLRKEMSRRVEAQQRALKTAPPPASLRLRMASACPSRVSQSLIPWRAVPERANCP